MTRPLTIYQILEKNHFDTGSVHQMFQAAEGLRERGHVVTIVTRPGPSLPERAAAAGIAVETLPMRSEADVRSVLALQRLVRRDDVDVIHVHKGLSHTLALAATLGTPVPAFVVNRGVSFPLTTWNRIKYRTRRVDRIITVCQQIKDVVVASGRVPDQKVSVVYAGVDLARFDPARLVGNDFRSEKGIAQDRFLIAQVGVRDWKGWRELIDSFSDVATEFPSAELMLIACRDDAQKEMVQRHASDRGVGPRVHAVEYRADMPRVLAAADCVVDASWEGTGITGTIREAMALAKPVIATDCGGNRELVSSPEVGWVVPMRDREALTAALRAVMSDSLRARATGLRARAHVAAGFSKEGRIDRLEKLYRQIVDSKLI